MTAHLDFDGDPQQLVEATYREAEEFQTPILEQVKRDYLLYRAFVDMTYRDNEHPQVALPKILAQTEQKTAQTMKALYTTRPFIPLESRREEFNPVTEMVEACLDEYLHRAGFYMECLGATKMNTLYGASFMEFLPSLEKVNQPIPVRNGVGGLTMVPNIVDRFRLRCQRLAPWEVFVDPFAKNLEEKDGCRYVVKLLFTSKRQVQMMQENGAYPDIDIDKLNAGHRQSTLANHVGAEILQAFGLSLPEGDDDMGVILRLETPMRYVDSWCGHEIIRDIANPFIGERPNEGHGRINLARMVHILDPHTQNNIWGIGEAKLNEVQVNILNDMYNSFFRREQFVGDPLVFFDKDRIDIDDLYWEPTNRIPVRKTQPGRPLGDALHIHAGAEMPKDGLIMMEKVERNIDMASGLFAAQRGEAGDADTATEVVAIRETGSERQELLIKGIEDIFLRNVATICLGHMNQFATPADYAEIVGPEKVQMALITNPNDIPGGYELRFKGSARVSNMLVKQRNLKELAPVLTALMNAGQMVLAEELMESHELDTDVINSVLEQGINLFMLQLGMAQAASAPDGGGGSRARGGQPGGKYKENNPKQIARDDSRTARGNNVN